MKAIERYFYMIRFIMLYKMLQSLNYSEETLVCDYQTRTTDHYFKRLFVEYCLFIRSTMFLQHFKVLWIKPECVAIEQGLFVQGMDNTILRISHYPVDTCWQKIPCFPLYLTIIHRS